MVERERREEKPLFRAEGFALFLFLRRERERERNGDRSDTNIDRYGGNTANKEVSVCRRKACK